MSISNYLSIQNCQRVLTVFLGAVLFACSESDTRDSKYPLREDRFDPPEVQATITDDNLLEVSGIEASKANRGHYWVHNDSGDKARILLLSRDGAIKAEVSLEGVVATDWEEITMTADSSLIIGDIGDNRGERPYVTLYKIKEPKIDSADRLTISKDEIDSMQITYAEGSRDAETLFYDFNSDSLVLITKREEEVMVYQFLFRNGTAIEIASKGTLPFRNLTSGDMNAYSEIILKNYDNIFYFLPAKYAIDKLLSEPDYRIPYSPEPQGEAITWSDDGRDLILLSEKKENAPQELLEIKRK